MNQTEFCENAQTQVAPIIPDPPTWCELTPPGMIVLMAGGADCPPGFVDDSVTFANRYLAVGASGGTVGTASDLGTRAASVHGVTSMSKPSGTAFTQEGFVAPEPFTGDTATDTANISVLTAEVAPAVLFRMCRRDGQCPP
jgi:hypothetical protein